MLDVASAEGGVVTEDGKRMFFNWRITGVSQVWRQDGAHAYPIQLTGGRGSTSIAALSPDGSYLVVARDFDGQENPGLYLLAPTGGPMTKLFHKPGVQAFMGFISDDARYIFFRTNEARRDAFVLFRFDRQTGATEAIVTEPGLWSVQDHRGDEVLLEKTIGNTHSEIWRLSLRDNSLRPLLGQDATSDWTARFGAVAGQYLVLTNHDDDFTRLWVYGPGEARRRISPDTPFDVFSFSIDHQRRRVYYVTNERGYSRLAMLDAATLRPMRLPPLPAHENAWGGGTTRNGRFSAFSFDGARSPAATIIHDWRRGKSVAWRTPSLPEVNADALVAPTLETYPARDGTPIPMFVYRPATCAQGAGAPCPVVVHFHGGPESQTRAGFSAFAQVFARAGFVLVQPNVRGSTGYGKAWLDADNGARRLAVVTDIEDCARYLRTAWRQGGVAPKLGVYGSSYGGFSTMFAMTYFAGSYDAGVASVGISNWQTFLKNTAPYRRALRISEYGDPVKDEAALRELSPITHATKLRAPLLLLQGVNDPRVPVGEALQFYDAVRAAGQPGAEVALILFADEGHGAGKKDNQVISLAHTLAFFKRHLQ